MSTGLVHYLALTFSTLLSSQASGAHRAGDWSPAWGNSTYFMRRTNPSQTGWCPSPPGAEDPGSAATRVSVPHTGCLVVQWVPSGSAAVVDSVPHPVKAFFTLLAGDHPVNPRVPGPRSLISRGPVVPFRADHCHRQCPATP